MKKTVTTLLCIIFLLFEGCAYVSIPLIQFTRPLKEKTLQGKGRNKILIIDISGIIAVNKKRSLTGFDTEPGPVARIKEELEKAAKDKKVKAVILRINSPGGTVTAADIIYREIIRFKEKKKVFVAACLMDVAASGGYYIANAADKIIAHPTTITGGIGVIAMKFNIKGLMDKVGIEEEFIKSGDKKDAFSPFRKTTKEEKKIIQDIIDSLHQQFLAVIDQGRKDLSLDDIKPLADGRVYTAGQARDYKLIDEVGYLDDAVSLAKRKAGISKARVIIYHRPIAYKNNIYSQSSINVFNFGESGLLEYLPIRFMYLWNP
jgi:protease-4